MSTPSDIARYSIDHKGRVIPMDGGIWMRHTDHLAARAADAKEIERLRDELAELKSNITAKAEAAFVKLMAASPPPLRVYYLTNMDNLTEILTREFGGTK